MNQSNLVMLESNVGQGAPGAAIQHETTTPDLEQDVFQIGGCGLRNGGAAAGASGKPQVTGPRRFPAPGRESTTPDLEQDVSHFGGCGLRASVFRSG